MSDMGEWAEREVKIACEREKANSDGDDWQYGCACYESALKAYKSLMEDGHSGMSISITKNILNRLIDGRPLTPIDDTPDVWRELRWGDWKDGEKEYQCNRMPSLFKTVHPDGTITYSDAERCYMYDTSDGSTWSSGFIRGIIDEMYPITMPYYPSSEKIKVNCTTFLANPKNGDYDTVGVHFAVKGDEVVEINRYFKCDENEDGGLKEISSDEYAERKRACESRRANK